MGNNCKRNSWIAAVVLGIIVFLIALPGFFGALVLGVIVALIVGFSLTVFFCKEDEAAPSGAADQSTAAVAAPAAAPAPAGAPASPATAEPDRPANSGAATASPAEAEPAPVAEPAAEPAEEPAAAPKPAPAAPAATDTDAPGTQPSGLTAARDGQPDDLRKIKGVGPKLQSTLNEMGYYHFDQIAAWTETEVAWVDQNLKGFKGRVSRDNWVEQARQLASGEGTEFSKRVDKGDVY